MRVEGTIESWREVSGRACPKDSKVVKGSRVYSDVLCVILRVIVLDIMLFEPTCRYFK